jgi:hypothetical protein
MTLANRPHEGETPDDQGSWPSALGSMLGSIPIGSHRRPGLQSAQELTLTNDRLAACWPGRLHAQHTDDSNNGAMKFCRLGRPRHATFTICTALACVPRLFAPDVIAHGRGIGRGQELSCAYTARCLPSYGRRSPLAGLGKVGSSSNSVSIR